MRTTSRTTSKIIAACLAAVILLLFWLLVSGFFGDGRGTSLFTAFACFVAMGAMGYFARFYWLYEDPPPRPAPKLPKRPVPSFNIANLTYDRRFLYHSVDELLTLAAQQSDADKLLAYSYYKAALDRAGYKTDRWNVLFQLASALDRDNAAEAMNYAHESLGYAQTPQQVGGSFGLIGLIHWKRGEYQEAYECARKEAEQFQEVNVDIRFYEKHFSAVVKAADCQWSIYQAEPALSEKRQEAWKLARMLFDKALSLADRRGLWSIQLHYGSTCRYLARLCEFEAYAMRMQNSERRALEWERRARQYKTRIGVSEAEMESALAGWE